MRLQVFLSHSGICSRRKALELVKSGEVSVNGTVVREPSFGVNPDEDKVLAQGALVHLPGKLYIKMNKPVGVITSRQDKFAKLIVTDLLPKKFRDLYPVGRLDRDTEGLLLLTNDGELTYRLTHPKFKIKKIYIALVKAEIDSRKKRRLESGIWIEGARTARCEVTIISSNRNKSRVKISIGEGKKRQIRKMFAKVGNPVIKLKRTQEASLMLGDLAQGQWRLLTTKEVEELYSQTGIKSA